mmetsp:Transcript_15416/g.42349  ORF Transcript_15416/g.42349 Transcript_15416/m.42349 type:complete len:320 (+) Transcript_15416:2931-3890(+)
MILCNLLLVRRHGKLQYGRDLEAPGVDGIDAGHRARTLVECQQLRLVAAQVCDGATDAWRVPSLSGHRKQRQSLAHAPLAARNHGGGKPNRRHDVHWLGGRNPGVHSDHVALDTHLATRPHRGSRGETCSRVHRQPSCVGRVCQERCEVVIAVGFSVNDDQAVSNAVQAQSLAVTVEGHTEQFPQRGGLASDTDFPRLRRLCWLGSLAHLRRLAIHNEVEQVAHRCGEPTSIEEHIGVVLVVVAAIIDVCPFSAGPRPRVCQGWRRPRASPPQVHAIQQRRNVQLQGREEAPRRIRTVGKRNGGRHAPSAKPICLARRA